MNIQAPITIINLFSTDKFVEVMIERLEYSSISTRTALVYIFVKLFSCEDFVKLLPDSISTKLPKSLVSALRNTDHEDLTQNSLGELHDRTNKLNIYMRMW